MPIVIVKGSDKNNNKTLNESNSEKSLYDSENPTNLPVSPSKKSSNSHSGNNVSTNEKANGKIQSAIVSDMTDILDFKVYHITRPSFNEPVSKTILLGGELFYNKEEINKAIHTVDEAVEVADESTPPNNKPSVLQKIRQMKYASKQINNVQRNQKDILMHVKAASDRTKLIKSGHSLPAHLNPPTADETLEWAIRHVNIHEGNLVEMLIEFEAGMKDFEKQKEREKAAVLNKTLQLAMHAAGGGKSCAEGNEVTAVSTVAATSMSNKMNSSSNNNNSSSTSASKAASAPSLSTLLDNLKSSGTEAFLSNITVIPARTTVTEPSAIGRKNSKQGGVAFNLKPNSESSNQQHSLTTINEPGNGRLQPQLPHSAIPPGRKGGAANNHSHRVVRGSSHTTSATHSTTTNNGHNTHSESPSEESEVQRFSRPTTAEESSAPGSHSPVNHFNRGRARTRTSSNADTVVTSATGDEGEEENEVRPSESTVPRPPPRDKKKPANKSQSSNKTYSGAHHRTYSNAQLDSSSSQQHSDINQMNSHTKDTISEMKRTQQLFDQAMGYTLDIFNQAAEKTKKMQNTIEAKLRRGNRGGQRIVKQWKAFRDINVQQRESANELCEDKEFFRALDMAENLSCFEMDGYDKASGNHKLGVNAAKDLQIMRRNAQISSFNKVMNRLTATKWYCAIVSKFREYMKRMNNNVPVCCLKFLVIFRYILSYDFPLSKELFYKVVESAVVVKEDFIRSIVHVVLRAARDALKISPQEFLAYLESRNIQPCPELLNQIRTLTQVASASGSQNQSRSSSPRSSPRGGVSSANGAMMCFDGLEMSLDMPVLEVLSLPADDAFSVPSSPRNFVLDMSKLTRKSVMIAEDSDQQSGAQSLLPAIQNSTVV